MMGEIAGSEAAVKLQIAKSVAIRLAMIEVLQRNRDEIMRIAREKLTVQGITLTEADLKVTE